MATTFSMPALGAYCGLAFLAAAGCRSPADREAPDPTARDSDAWFEEVSAEAGLDFRHNSGVDGSFFFPEHIGSGGALFDYDGDGDLDVYLVESGYHQPEKLSLSAPNRLFRQEHDGRFADLTAISGLGDRGYGMGAAVGDVDNDGDLDVYVTNYGPDALYRNDGDGRFTEVTAAAGLGDPGWSTSACFFDADADGALDLYAVTYVLHDPPKVCTDAAGRPEYCGPAAFRGTPDLFYRNRGDGTFEDRATTAGMAARPNKGLGVICADLDADGDDDVYVANDGEPNNLWINRGDGIFEDRAVILGAATNMQGEPEASMGIALGDVDGDLELDFFLTHLNRETNTFYRGLGSAGFEDATAASRLGPESLPYTGFGTAFLDAENDGDLDLVIVNGRVRRGPPLANGGEQLDTVSPDITDPAAWHRYYAEPDLLFLNQEGTFHLATAEGGDLTTEIEVGRGLLVGDLDRDGRLDLVLSNSNSPARLFHNRAPRRGYWTAVRAVDPVLDRDATGARVTVASAGAARLGLLISASSYLANVEPVAHFGLGEADRIDRMEIGRPGGRSLHIGPVAADRYLLVRHRLISPRSDEP